MGLACDCLMRCCWSMLAQSCHRSCTMFESAELGHRIDKARFREESPALRQALLEAQYELRERVAARKKCVWRNAVWRQAW